MQMDSDGRLPSPEESLNNEDGIGGTSSGSQYGTQAQTA